MRIMALSDLHGATQIASKAAAEARRLEVNAIILAGDITHFDDVKKAEEILSIFRTSEVPVWFVPGNCDEPEILNVKMDGCSSLHGKSIQFEGFVIVGVGGCNISPFGTLIELEEADITKVLNAAIPGSLRGERLILVSHPPPYGCNLDVVYDPYYHGQKHVGSTSVLEFVEKTKPAIVFCGHIHESRGIDLISSSTIVNTAPAFEGWFALADLDDKVDVQIRRLQ